METLHVENLSEFISQVQRLIEAHPPDFKLQSLFGQTFYRGHGDSSWKIESSLYRSGLAKSEQLLVGDALRLAPGEFSGLTNLQKLAKMQHLGLPTRLIDITTNPLAALYFACEQEDVSGEVIVFSNIPTGSETLNPTPPVMEFIFGENNSWHNLSATDFSERVSGYYRPLSSSPSELRSMVLRDLQQIYTAVLVPNSENRIMRQSGAFLVSGMKLTNQKVSTNPGTLGQIYWDFDPCDVDNLIVNSSGSEGESKFSRISIPAEAKPNIMAELDRIDVNEMRLFPEPEHTMRYIYENYRTKRWAMFGEGLRAPF